MTEVTLTSALDGESKTETESCRNPLGRRYRKHKNHLARVSGPSVNWIDSLDPFGNDVPNIGSLSAEGEIG